MEVQRSHLQVRAARIHDARAIAEVHQASWLVAYGDLLDPETLSQVAEVNLSEREASWTDRIPRTGSDGYRTWVADEAGTIVGLAFTQPTPDDDLDPLEVAELKALYVHPDWFGRGAGRGLLERAVGGMRAQGFLQATLWVVEGNDRAIGFYERAGWKADGKREPCFRVFNAPALRYRLPL